MTSQISSALPPELDPGVGQGAVTRLPGFLHEPFSTALSQSLLLPAFVALLGVIAALFLRGSGGGAVSGSSRRVDARSYVEPDYFRDDDDYVEYTVEWPSRDESDEPDRVTRRRADVRAHAVIAPDESATTPLAIHLEHPLRAPLETWHDPQVDHDPDTVPEPITIAEHQWPPEPIPPDNEHAPWRSILDDLLDDSTRPPAPVPEPIGFAHNGFHVEAEANLQTPPQPRAGRHSRDESRGDDDAGTYGRHSMRFRD